MTPLTINTHWLSGPRLPEANVRGRFTAVSTGEYSDTDVANIIGWYYETGAAVGIDPALACAQMWLETGHLTSAWSQRPHRNPAGIGVTGAPGAGVSFPSWLDAVRAHVGRLLAYALPWGAGTGPQLALIEDALAWRDLPDARRGLGADVETLARFWAADPAYPDKLIGVLNDWRRV